VYEVHEVIVVCALKVGVQSKVRKTNPKQIKRKWVMQQKWWWHQQILGGVCIVKQGAAINKHPTHNENAEIETGGARRLKRGCHGEKAFRPNFFKIKKKENPNL